MASAEQWATHHGDTVEVYEATDGWRYHVWAGNGEIIEQGSEAYTRKAAAVTAAERNHPRVERSETSDFDGATQPPPPDSYPKDAGEFAASWNSWSVERRDRFVRQMVENSEAAVNCLLRHRGRS